MTRGTCNGCGAAVSLSASDGKWAASPCRCCEQTGEATGDTAEGRNANTLAAGRASAPISRGRRSSRRTTQGFTLALAVSLLLLGAVLGQLALDALRLR